MTRIELIRKLILRDLTIGENLLASLAFVGVPTAIRYVLGESANPVPFIPYFPFILLAAVFQGWRWAALATLVSALLVDWVFLYTAWPSQAVAQHIAILLFFGASCAILILAGDTLRRTVRQMNQLAHEKEMLSDEMHHRVRNAFTVVQALVRMSKSAGDLSQFREDLLGRVHALDQANHILRDKVDERFSVRQLVELAIEPFRQGGDFELDGPDCSLTPQASYQLLLIIHELCTNAIKHGALSARHGKVFVSWNGTGNKLSLKWCEEGGPVVMAPAQSGLGLRLLKGQSGFKANLLFERTGLICELVQTH